MNLGKLLNIKRPVVLRVQSKTIPATPRRPAQTLTTDLLPIVRLINYGSEIYVEYFYNNRTNAVYLTHDTKVAIARSKEAKDLKEKLIEYQFKKLIRTCGPSGMIGFDPEFFVYDKETGKVINAFDFLGSKKNPSHPSTSERGFCNNIYWDGFQAEFDTHPAACLGYALDSTYNGIKGLLELAMKHNKNARILGKPTIEVDPEELNNAKEEHVQFGCMPSMNAYGLTGQQMDGRLCPIRSAGGHIHFGIGKTEKKDADAIVKCLDAIVGVACVSMFANIDDPRRRTMYGLAGEYRLPDHGIEYRVLSNAWMYHPLIANIVCDLARRTVTFARNGLFVYWKHDEQETIRIINECDYKAAREVLKRNDKVFRALLNACYGICATEGSADAIQQIDKLVSMFMEGAESFIQDVTNIEQNWKLPTPENMDRKYILHSSGDFEGNTWYKTRKLVMSGKKVG